MPGWIAIGICLVSLVAGCAGPAQPVMRTETLDATRSRCRLACDDQRAKCLQRKRPAQPSGPAQTDQTEWSRLVHEGQEMARACEERQRECVARCFD